MSTFFLPRFSFFEFPPLFQFMVPLSLSLCFFHDFLSWFSSFLPLSFSLSLALSLIYFFVCNYNQRHNIKFYIDNLKFLSFPQVPWCPLTVRPPPSRPRQPLILFPSLQFTMAYSRSSCNSQCHNMYSFVSVSFDWLECVRLIQAVVYHKHLFLFYCWVIPYWINIP